MNPIFKYSNAKNLTKDLKGGHNVNDFSLLNVYLRTICKNPAAEYIFKCHHIVAQVSLMTVGYDEWPLSNALWMKFYSFHGK